MFDHSGPSLESGDVLAHYRIESRIGEGAMGTTYRARDTSLDRTVCLKVLNPDVSKNDAFVCRFVREAQAAARVGHPNLTHVHFIGEQEGRHFFAMELVEGRDLETRVSENGPFDLEEALDIVIQVARGLRAAHRVGVVHRDVKPSNILLQPDGVAKITDFGLAKSLDADVVMTQAGQILGTPAYMSPEQCRGAGVDPRTDIYALGLVAWFLLAGRRPYTDDSLGALIDSQLHTPLPSVVHERDDVPVALNAALRHMCAKDPDRRMADMDSVIRELQACRPRPVHPAPLVTRAVAALIDLVLITTVAATIELVVDRLLGIDDFSDTLLGNVLIIILFLTYNVVCEARWGQTIGKRLLQIEVLTDRGMRPPSRILLPRFLIRYPLMVLGLLTCFNLHAFVSWIGYGLQLAVVAASIVTYFAARRRTLSDLATRTRVVVRLARSFEEPRPPQDRSSMTK